MVLNRAFQLYSGGAPVGDTGFRRRRLGGREARTTTTARHSGSGRGAGGAPSRSGVEACRAPSFRSEPPRRRSGRLGLRASGLGSRSCRTDHRKTPVLGTTRCIGVLVRGRWRRCGVDLRRSVRARGGGTDAAEAHQNRRSPTEGRRAEWARRERSRPRRHPRPRGETDSTFVSVGRRGLGRVVRSGDPTLVTINKRQN